MTKSKKIFFTTLWIWLVASSVAFGEELIVPREGGVVVLDGQTLAELRRVEFGEAPPLLSVHPQAPILASLQGGNGLVFWNLPTMVEASRHEHALFDGVSAMHFSEDGDELYLLSSKLRGIVVFDLSRSKVKGLIPVPGSPPKGFSVAESGLVVEQADGISLVSTEPQDGLVAQFRFPENLNSSVVAGAQLFVALRGVPALTSYQLPSGRVLNFMPTNGEVTYLASGSTPGEVVSLDGNGQVQKWAPAGGRSWTGPALGVGVRAVCASRKGRLYTFDETSGTILVLDAEAGTELARSQVVGGSGQPVVYSK